MQRLFVIGNSGDIQAVRIVLDFTSYRTGTHFFLVNSVAYRTGTHFFLVNSVA